MRAYREGGLGRENVLTAEVFTALDFLPRAAFLGAVIATAQGADRARDQVVSDIEEAVLTVLPDEVHLPPDGQASGNPLVVQPDAIMTTAMTYVLVEAKRIRRSSFQREQLAREYVAVMQEAAARTPLLLLILGAPPPVAVEGLGRMSIEDVILSQLTPVLARAGTQLDIGSLEGGVSQVVAWTTWHQLDEVVKAQEASLHHADATMAGTISRLVRSISESVARHS